MELDDKYLKLVNLLVHDKRTKSNGFICSLEISRMIGGFGISYRALFDGRMYQSIYVEDFEKGNIVFLIPFRIDYMQKEFEKIGEEHKQIIKEFFGEGFREDMIIEISEEERQRQIRKYDRITKSLDLWCDIFKYDDNKTEE